MMSSAANHALDQQQKKAAAQAVEASTLNNNNNTNNEEELDEASVWEMGFFKVRDEKAKNETGGSSSEEGKENNDDDDDAAERVRRGGGHRKRQSFVLDEEDALVGFGEKEDSSKSVVTNLVKAQAHHHVSSPSSEHIPIKQKHSRTGGDNMSYSLSFMHQGDLGSSLSPRLLGTSAPINIPGNENSFYQKRGSNGSNVVESPRSSTRAEGFVPPHLIGAEDDGQDPELSTSIMKREQLKHRNTILKQTGYLEEPSATTRIIIPE
ncbi:hypothetical protein HOP50_15g74080 [Chloropicon primus]|uniref:Uncharacterized protein n=1 Tax=Chloropicon primus TaxID=1764295 RepID=A0A5B8MYX3_9CHLO|nr:hypothetical protein A3770_15p73830 [Chloropicon primus]UPR04075.1 hypothetical protein HOP50_15g74080 [Chloropicon primus]|mmetsp:Transcript_10018/g.20328  ORF Transcript_10018/g.20328 Transcript_10018/m.20328 type:complete len:265 (+) Transcript_10018:529-1323(+)|eukprot:QDZ24865.1 hypothetical protein A3770_15p73830 [Chloropicon primus]